MTKNIVVAIQQSLGLDSFDKIDPNLESENHGTEHDSKHFVQAAVTGVLAGLYKYTSIKDGTAELFAHPQAENILQQLFGDKEEYIIGSVSSYGEKPYDHTRLFMEKIAQEAINIIGEQTGPNPTSEQVRSYLITQRHNILVYLPPALQVGSLINDNVLDDRTNKMEGPVSNLMHFFEQLFTEKEKPAPH